MLAIILGEGAHIEIVKRCSNILKFLARNSKEHFDFETVELIWKCQAGKHEEMVRTVYQVIETILPCLSTELIDCFYARIS